MWACQVELLKALQCQSSVLDNDVGSSGPPVSGSLSIPKTGLGSVAAQKPSSSIQNLNSSGELKNDYEEASTENEESTMPSTSFSSVPTKSSEMDSKMLQQLDKLVSVMLRLVKITEAPVSTRHDTDTGTEAVQDTPWEKWVLFHTTNIYRASMKKIRNLSMEEKKKKERKALIKRRKKDTDRKEILKERKRNIKERIRASMA
ncbi:hypothetical protein FEM48_Zijuj03G0032000 [Ziziphus jujuba var. spinosa]|uniref:Uncharacterized protein n=1 Tax=Ziziphus jujuba var. spinosa TaxID=714518 RepID=A0A978VMU5_ZIZJJ|nr:hypothetical protein FEM48_Zijuj03G0032000 [Ziziphus jujuba var. spinosa]